MFCGHRKTGHYVPCDHHVTIRFCFNCTCTCIMYFCCCYKFLSDLVVRPTYHQTMRETLAPRGADSTVWSAPATPGTAPGDLALPWLELSPSSHNPRGKRRPCRLAQLVPALAARCRLSCSAHNMAARCTDSPGQPASVL